MRADSPPPNMQRVVVVGVTGAGKTTLAAALARSLLAAHVEIDALQWRENWTKAPLDEILAALAEATRAPRWVADGNYASVRQALWPLADTIVWLDYGLGRCLWRVTVRTVRRVLRRELLWGVNRESIRNTLLSKDGLLVWALQTHGRYRAEYRGLMRGRDYAHLRWVRLRSPRQARAWLQAVAPAQKQEKPDSVLESGSVGAEGLEPPTSRM